MANGEALTDEVHCMFWLDPLAAMAQNGVPGTGSDPNTNPSPATMGP